MPKTPKPAAPCCLTNDFWGLFGGSISVGDEPSLSVHTAQKRNSSGGVGWMAGAPTHLGMGSVRMGI